jgi:hypothetical protein
MNNIVVRNVHPVSRNKISNFENEVAKLPQIELPLTHRFAPGLYIREIFMPAGSVVVSMVHKEEHFTIVQKGRATVVTEYGTVEITAPYSQITPPGTKRVLYIHEDSIWITVHHNPDNITDIEKLEAHYAVPSFQEYEALTSTNDLLKLEEIKQ